MASVFCLLFESIVRLATWQKYAQHAGSHSYRTITARVVVVANRALNYRKASMNSVASNSTAAPTIGTR